MSNTVNALESAADNFYLARTPGMTYQASFRSRLAIPAALLACVAACLALSSQSLWVDEAQTALKAIQPTLPGWWGALWQERNTNIQLPLYMLYIWGWARLFGVSELALRAANLPWFFIALGAIAHCLRARPALRNIAFVVFCLHPFVWYYLDEARPYLMQLSGATLVAGALFQALDRPEAPLSAGWWWLFGAGMVVLCGTGILGIPWAIAITVLLLFRPGFLQSAWSSGRGALLVCVPLLCGIALYFAWTIKEKIVATDLNPSLRSMMSVLYDQLGFGGLGPGRLALRIGARSIFQPYLGTLAMLGVPLAWSLILAASRRFGLSVSRLLAMLAVVGCPVVAILVIGYQRHTRILGRHLMPLFPFLLLALACALLFLWRSGRLFNRVAAVLIVVMLAVSSLEVRFAPRHAKDDERSAAQAAAQALAQGKTVWWVASSDGARYYHLPISIDETPGAVWILAASPPRYSGLPDEIFVSRPDVTDRSGTIAAFIAGHHYRLAGTWQAFTAWER